MIDDAWLQRAHGRAGEGVIRHVLSWLDPAGAQPPKRNIRHQSHKNSRLRRSTGTAAAAPALLTWANENKLDIVLKLRKPMENFLFVVPV